MPSRRGKRDQSRPEAGFAHRGFYAFRVRTGARASTMACVCAFVCLCVTECVLSTRRVRYALHYVCTRYSPERLSCIERLRNRNVFWLRAIWDVPHNTRTHAFTLVSGVSYSHCRVRVLTYRNIFVMHSLARTFIQLFGPPATKHSCAVWLCVLISWTGAAAARNSVETNSEHVLWHFPRARAARRPVSR